ncbi:MAG: hypothetical protein UY07_C0018G0015 [Parcubacteria group bacterium GW2011_GWA1_47_8]|nr:MAG: hypothetical protein UY07_C0018G0015 [Parcubacteria group bacterium GW2011_GWA1_47_8]
MEKEHFLQKRGYTPVRVRRITEPVFVKKYNGYPIVRIVGGENVFCCTDMFGNEWVEPLETLWEYSERSYKFSKDYMLLNIPVQVRKAQTPFCVIRKSEPFFIGRPGDKIVLYPSGVFYLTRVAVSVQGSMSHFVTCTIPFHINATEENVFRVVV